MSGLGKFRTGGDLQVFLAQFQEIMEECEVEGERWNNLLYARLRDDLAERMRPMKEEAWHFWTMSR